ncbi:MAG: hypothetical protein ACRC9R_09510, partial [Enterovibrio sp.]
TYANELQGKQKTQESFSDLFNITKKLRNYGEGFVSFAQPILVHPFLSAIDERWQRKLDADKALPAYWPSLINQLASQTMTNINRVANVNALSLCVYALLAAKEYTLSQTQLQNQLHLLLSLLKISNHGENLQQTSPAELIEHVCSLKKITVDNIGHETTFSLTRQQAQLSHYYYNNTSHLFIIEALIIHLLLQKAATTATLLAKVQSLYTLLKAEFFLAFDEQKLEPHITAVLQFLLQKELIFCENERWIAIDEPQQQLQGLTLPIREFLQRYTKVLALLANTNTQAPSPLTAQNLSKMLHKESQALQDSCDFAADLYDPESMALTLHALQQQGAISDKGHCQRDKILQLQNLLLTLSQDQDEAAIMHRADLAISQEEMSYSSETAPQA